MARRRHPTDEVNAALAATIGRPSTVLDVGCGTGASGMAARAANARVVGLEPDSRLRERAKRVLSEVLDVNPADADAVRSALGDRRFELVILPDILERVDSPGDVVSRFAEYLEPEGRLVLSVRNRDAWPVRMKLRRPELGYEAPDQRLLSRDEVVRLAENAGLEVLQVDHNPMLLKALRAVVGETFDLTRKEGELEATGFRDLSAYQLYLSAVRPFEVRAVALAPRWLAYQHVVVARRRPVARPLSLTVGMLTMDEEPSIAQMMAEIRRYAPDAQILCVDSSVKDDTPRIAERLGARVIRQLPPRGHGPAMELLMYEAARQSEALIYLDCDFTYPPRMIPELRRILESGVDLVNAARTRTKPEAMPLANYVANKAFVYAAQALNGMPLADLHSGMRAYRSSLIRAFSFSGEGDALPIDTLLWPARCGYQVVEVPLEYQERVGISKLRKLTGTVWTFIRLANTLKVGTRRKGTYHVWTSVESP